MKLSLYHVLRAVPAPIRTLRCCRLHRRSNRWMRRYPSQIHPACFLRRGLLPCPTFVRRTRQPLPVEVEANSRDLIVMVYRFPPENAVERPWARVARAQRPRRSLKSRPSLALTLVTPTLAMIAIEEPAVYESVPLVPPHLNAILYALKRRRRTTTTTTTKERDKRRCRMTEGIGLDEAAGGCGLHATPGSRAATTLLRSSLNWRPHMFCPKFTARSAG